MSDWPLIAALIFAVALLYASVGHGGASGYLAVLSFFHFAPAAMTSSALVLNVVVAGLAWLSFSRAGHFSLRLVLPFLAASLPMAFLGGLLTISPGFYGLLLAISLTLAAIRLTMPNGRPEIPDDRMIPPWGKSLLPGGLIGLLSGIVGIGGGIFLSPVLLLTGWAGPKRTAAVSAFFIGVNSIAGLAGRGFSLQLDPSLILPFVLPAFAGGLIGSHLGANRFSSAGLRRVLGVVLLMAALRELGKVFAG